LSVGSGFFETLKITKIQSMTALLHIKGKKA
jgi:hypothetical protein